MEAKMNSFCGILDIRNKELDFNKLRDMGKGLTYKNESTAEACIDRGVGILCAGTPAQLYTKSTPQGELYIAIDSASLETNVSNDALADTFYSVGYDTPSELYGHFALAVFDRKKRELSLATDPLGAKPIFLHKDKDKIVISSALPALLRYSPACAEVDKAAVLELIRAPEGEITATDIFKNISELSAGHFMIFSGLGAQILKYTPKKDLPPAPPPDITEKELLPDKLADLKECAEIMTTALGYPSFDAYTPEYINAIRAAAKDQTALLIPSKRHSLLHRHNYRKIYALANRFGVSTYLTESESDTVFKKSFLSAREKKLSEIASAILQDEQSHTRRLFGPSLETIVSKESDALAKIGIWGKIIGLERWLESYPIAPI